MAEISELVQFLKAHDDYVLVGHVSPDGDTSGSCIALALALQALSKRAFVCLPGGLAKMYQVFEASVEIIGDGNAPFVPKTGLSVDVSTAERMGAGGALFLNCEHRAVLDHHATNEGFGEVSVIDPNAAAVGELAVSLIRELGVSLTPEMAQWLFIAISTDCGQFGFSNTRPETMEAAAECLRAGIDVDRITRELYRTRSKGRTKLLGLVLSGLEMDETGQLCWARLTRKMLDEAGALREDNEGIVNYLLEIRGVKFALIAEERDEHSSKFSLRSKAPIDAARAVAQPLGGGGHARAAGVSIDRPMEEALQMVLARAKAAIQDSKEQG